MSYPCEIFGDLLIPFYELHGNVEKPYSEDEVIIRKKENPFEIPDLKVRSFKDRLIEARKEDAVKNNRVFFDSPAARLVSYSVDEDNHKLFLDIQDTTYFTFAATNKSLDNEEVRRMVQERGPSYENLDDGLANAIGVSVNLISEPDNSIVIIERSKSLDQYPGLYGIPAGFFNPKKHDNNPVNTSKMEVKEEVGVPLIPEKTKITRIGRAGDDKHGEFVMSAVTPYSKEKIIAAPKSAKWEGKILPENIIPFEPNEMMKLMVKTIKEEPKGVPKGSGVWVPGRSPSWVPAHWAAVEAQLVNEFGFDEVWDAYEKCRQRQSR